MLPGLRLAINNLSARRSRTALLVACVAMCAALVTAITCAISSVNNALESRVADTVGAADLRIAHVGNKPLDASIALMVAKWPEVDVVNPRGIEPLILLSSSAEKPASARVIATGLVPETDKELRSIPLSSGVWISGDNQVVLDERAASELGAVVGATLSVEKFGTPVILSVVGISKKPPLSGVLGAPLPVYVNLRTLAIAAGKDAANPQPSEIEILLKGQRVDARARTLLADSAMESSQRATAVAQKYAGVLPEGVIVQPSARQTATFARNREMSQVGLVLISVFAFLAAGFIVATGLTTAVSERTRELAIMRAIGATRMQTATAQLFTGAIIAAMGALIGIPIGTLGAYVLVTLYPDQLPGGFTFSALGAGSAMIGALLSGTVGAGWSAIAASRVSPLQGLTIRSKPPRVRTIVLITVAALVLIATHLGLVALRPGNEANFFWYYVPIGIPSILGGYFLLSIPMILLVSFVLSPVLEVLLRLPPRLLARTLAQTPFRHGFTSGSLMLGLAMLVSIWISGSSVLDGWLDKLRFPDGFVTGLSMPANLTDRLSKQPGIADACAITIHNVNTDAFGIKGLTQYRTSFVAFEPEPFFRMTRLDWVQGNEATAKAELAKGSAIIVSKEFLVTRKLGVGDSIKLSDRGTSHTFRIVGVVASPGLDLASKFFDVGEGYLDQAVNAVFGTRADLLKIFSNDSINLVQLTFTPGIDPEETLKAVRRMPQTGILAAANATGLKSDIRTMLSSTLKIFSIVAIGAMVVASFGVANIIVAGVQARTYQLGVLRAIGATRGMIARLVLAEAIVIGVTASILGTLLGIQGAWGGQNVSASSIGIEVTYTVPIVPIVVGVVVITAVALIASVPTAYSLLRKPPRVLLASTRG